MRPPGLIWDLSGPDGSPREFARRTPRPLFANGGNSYFRYFRYHFFEHIISEMFIFLSTLNRIYSFLMRRRFRERPPTRVNYLDKEGNRGKWNPKPPHAPSVVHTTLPYPKRHVTQTEGEEGRFYDFWAGREPLLLPSYHHPHYKMATFLQPLTWWFMSHPSTISPEFLFGFLRWPS